MDLETTPPPDRTEAIKDLIERWIEKNKAKELIQVISDAVPGKQTEDEQP